MYGYIYKITCTAGSFSGRFYIGQRRWSGDIEKDKYKGSGKLINDYYKKHPNEYTKEVLAIAESREELNQLEKDFIAPHLNTQDCLNVREGGNHDYDYTASEETRAKLSRALKGRTCWCKGMKLWYSARRGVRLSEETRRKISNSKMGQSSPRKGVHLSDETKAKLSASHKGRSYCTKGKPPTPAKKAHLDAIRRQYAVLQIDKDTGNVIAIFESSKDAWRKTGICATTIQRCCAKKPNYKTAGGYVWEYQN